MQSAIARFRSRFARVHLQGITRYFPINYVARFPAIQSRYRAIAARRSFQEVGATVYRVSKTGNDPFATRCVKPCCSTHACVCVLRALRRRSFSGRKSDLCTVVSRPTWYSYNPLTHLAAATGNTRLQVTRGFRDFDKVGIFSWSITHRSRARNISLSHWKY